MTDAQLTAWKAHVHPGLLLEYEAVGGTDALLRAWIAWADAGHTERGYRHYIKPRGIAIVRRPAAASHITSCSTTAGQPVPYAVRKLMTVPINLMERTEEVLP